MTSIRVHTCCVCGAALSGKDKQHWNRDHGFGVCVACVAAMKQRGTADEEIVDLYGIEGVNWGVK